MSKLALQGGKPVTKNLIGTTQLISRRDLERRYLLETFDKGPLDDWPGAKSTAAAFAAEFAAFQGARHCSLITNGTHTLQLALESLGIGWGDEVIVPGMTWQATASTVCDVNAVPVLVDIEPDTLCMDPAKVEAAITPRTRAIVPVHLYNRLANMDRLLAIARRHKLHVIEDCAHSHGSQWKGHGTGSMGVFGSFSFQNSKSMRAGEGGALIMNSKDLYGVIESQRCCGRRFPERPKAQMHSGNYRMTSLQAALLRGQLAAMHRNAAVMDRNGQALDRAVAAAPGVLPMRRDPRITRQVGYCYAFRYDSEAYDGVPLVTFRKALAAELSWDFFPAYTPLHHSELYTPHTKRRHQISAAYTRAITPSRWKLPVAHDIWENRAVITLWQIYGLAPSRAHFLSDAIAKLHENRAELRKLASK